MELTKKRLLQKNDLYFYLILLTSAVIHLSFAVYLGTIEIKEKGIEEAMMLIPKRFARLLLQPAEDAIKKAAFTPLPAKKEEPVMEVKKIEEPVVKAKRSEVRSRGLLGVIMAKGGPRSIALPDTFRDVDKVMKEVKKDRVRDVLSGLDIKEADSAAGITLGVGAAPSASGKDTREILTEKKDVSLDEPDKGMERRTVSAKDNLNKYEEDVYKTILSYTGGLKFLYNNSLRKDPSIKGRVTVKIIIMPDGKAKEVEILSSLLNAPDLEEAIVERIRMWKFPPYKLGESFSITYTFDFSPQG